MRAPRRRTLRLAALLALTLLTTAAAAAFIRRALACPVEIPPQTLRTLYKHGDRIVVARVGHTELVERDEDSSRVRTALHVVKGFADARLVPFLVAQLRRVEDNPPTEAEEWLAVLSEVLNNEEAVDLVTNYSANVTYYEEEEEPAGDESAGTDEEFDQKEQDARDAAATVRATKKRSAMLEDLLARVERILASPPDVARQ